MKNKRVNISHNGLASWGDMYTVNNAMLDSGVEDNVWVNNDERCQGIRRQRCFEKDAKILAIRVWFRIAFKSFHEWTIVGESFSIHKWLDL